MHRGERVPASFAGPRHCQPSPRHVCLSFCVHRGFIFCSVTAFVPPLQQRIQLSAAGLLGDAKLHPLCMAKRALATRTPSGQGTAGGMLSPEIPVFNPNPTAQATQGFLQGLTPPWLVPAFCTSKAYAVVVSQALLEGPIVPLFSG